ncbi:hypothetical protein SAMD00019534_015580 [Acytostelium subglobosum LB1]|uniref:hypothetical protein n=1 Tax=Acytostelium subglobosum LB1 TaxID=1410327 RepID=UPI0006451202|nr:hypothetical protein SAMD00019534_015580 [Acytostelium subglobosum LB1]GAM18383.1 hypothetical protein SAMD00019534_015580 [Acytostelium subglobosum LB1]|eukprot:XP_012757603.1 hypothetical protein SAMD00019534_015580 [Acytostelium subglobosum LB1]
MLTRHFTSSNQIRTSPRYLIVQQQQQQQYKHYSTTTKMSNKAGATAENNKQKPEDTIFAKIVAGTIPCKKVYEDDFCLAFDDLNPVAPVHVLVVPKTPLGGIHDATEEHAVALGKLMVNIPKIATIKGLETYRLVVNEGADAGQSVRWLHIHIIGGRGMNWPPG